LRSGLVLPKHKNKYPENQYKTDNGIYIQFIFFHLMIYFTRSFKLILVPICKYMSNCKLYAKVAPDYCFWCFSAALINATNKGCGLSTVLLYSGWYCTPMNQGWEGSSTISTNPVSILIPEATSPAPSNCSL